MRPNYGKSAFFGILAGVILISAVALTFWGRYQLPVLAASAAEGARGCVQEVMDHICAGDYGAASAGIYGGADLGMESRSESAVNRLCWEAYLDSLAYELVGPVYASRTGVVQDVQITGLDLQEMTGALGEKTQELLALAVAKAEDVSRIYGEDNGYQESFVEEIMEQAARAVLQEDLPRASRVVPVKMKYSGGRWLIVADDLFVNGISGIHAG